MCLFKMRCRLAKRVFSIVDGKRSMSIVFLTYKCLARLSSETIIYFQFGSQREKKTPFLL